MVHNLYLIEKQREFQQQAIVQTANKAWMFQNVKPANETIDLSPTVKLAGSTPTCCSV